MGAGKTFVCERWSFTAGMCVCVSVCACVGPSQL